MYPSPQLNGFCRWQVTKGPELEPSEANQGRLGVPRDCWLEINGEINVFFFVKMSTKNSSFSLVFVAVHACLYTLGYRNLGLFKDEHLSPVSSFLVLTEETGLLTVTVFQSWGALPIFPSPSVLWPGCKSQFLRSLSLKHYHSSEANQGSCAVRRHWAWTSEALWGSLSQHRMQGSAS